MLKFAFRISVLYGNEVPLTVALSELYQERKWNRSLKW